MQKKTDKNNGKEMEHLELKWDYKCSDEFLIFSGETDGTG